ncbi:putative RNA-directed DNA polymerase [Tanacetum coccineum]|uniref:RNA-directed DNA polymerase n=1 Tax=Tanacetum coccineum TaxID=301880 RepID=A0ABQ4ZYY7_9ASTR
MWILARCVKEKKQGDGGAHSLGNGGALMGTNAAQSSNTVDDVGKDSDGLNSSPTMVTLGNSAVNKEDNLHDENNGLTPSKSTANLNKGTSYANLFTGGPSMNAMNFRTLFTPAGNRVVVVVPVESIRAISERFANTAYCFFWESVWLTLLVLTILGTLSSMDGLDKMLENCPWFIRNNLFILKMWNPDVNLLKEDVGNVPVWVKLHVVLVTAFSEDGLLSYARELIKVRADVELKDNIVVDMPKLVGEGSYTCNLRVEYEWKPPRCACYKVFGHVQDECPKNIDSDVVKNMKKPSQTPRGVPVGPKVGFKPVKQVYRHVFKKNNVNTSSTKKKDVEPTIENVESSSNSTTHIVENFDKMERLIIDGKVTLVDDEGKPLTKVDYSGDHDSEDEVASIDNDIAIFLASKKVGYGQDIPDMIQDICDNLDIKVRGCKKK